jgi:hypothetical protein
LAIASDFIDRKSTWGLIRTTLPLRKAYRKRNLKMALLRWTIPLYLPDRPRDPLLMQTR